MSSSDRYTPSFELSCLPYESYKRYIVSKCHVKRSRLHVINFGCGAQYLSWCEFKLWLQINMDLYLIWCSLFAYYSDWVRPQIAYGTDTLARNGWIAIKKLHLYLQFCRWLIHEHGMIEYISLCQDYSIQNEVNIKIMSIFLPVCLLHKQLTLAPKLIGKSKAVWYWYHIYLSEQLLSKQ